MANDANIANKIKEMIAERLDCKLEEVTEDARFIDDLGADSLDQADLMVEFEKTFSVRFPPGSVEQIQSIGEVVALIETARAA